MTFRNRSKNLSPPIRIGLVLLALANIGRLLTIHRPGSFTDAAVGMLYGMSIALLLLGLIRKNRCSRSTAGLRSGAGS